MDRIFFPDAAMNLDILVPGFVSRKVKAHGERTMIVEVYFETGAEGARHEHPHEQLSYCLEGEFDFFVAGETKSLKAGDSILIPGGARHGVQCLAKGRLLDLFSPPREDFLAR
jgi:quercetin dioxygenase-like cupin family protein